MDVRTLKKACGVGLLAVTALTNPVAHAANGSVNVDVNLPTVLVMYYFGQVTLNIDEAGLATYLGAGGTPCVGGDYCDAQPDPGAIDVLTVNATTNVPMPALNDPYGAGPGAVTFVLEDVVGVRALGCTTPYDATYNVTGDAGITPAAGLSVANIDGSGCSMTLLTGDLSFDLDFEAVTAGTTTVNATLDVTITGA